MKTISTLSALFIAFCISFASDKLSLLPPGDPCSTPDIQLNTVSTSNSFSGGTTFTVYFTVDGVQYWTTYNNQTGQTNTNYSGSVSWGGPSNDPYVIIDAVNPCGSTTDTLAMNDPPITDDPNTGAPGSGSGNTGNNGGGNPNGNNGHGNNTDGVDSSNPGQGSGGPNGSNDPSGSVDDENGSGGNTGNTGNNGGNSGNNGGNTGNNGGNSGNNGNSGGNNGNPGGNGGNNGNSGGNNGNPGGNGGNPGGNGGGNNSTANGTGNNGGGSGGSNGNNGNSGGNTGNSGGSNGTGNTSGGSQPCDTLSLTVNSISTWSTFSGTTYSVYFTVDTTDYYSHYTPQTGNFDSNYSSSYGNVDNNSVFIVIELPTSCGGTVQDTVYFSTPYNGVSNGIAPPQVEAEESTKVYPNPATEVIYLSYSRNENERNVQFILLNQNGETEVVQGIFEETQTIDVSRIQPGVYYYTIISDGATVKRSQLIIR